MQNADEPHTNYELDPQSKGNANAKSMLEQTQVFADDSNPTNSNSTSGSSGLDKQSASSEKSKNIGGYRLIKLLGQGGMGRVFQAVDESGRMVAIKLLSPELSRSPEALDRFKQEGVIASAISHPHCVFVHRADDDCGTPFIAMELMTGKTLKDTVSTRGPLPAAEAVSLSLQCIDGLIEAHSRGMIHRDVKPANCYLDEQGNVKIGDFGLARSLVADSELTRTGSFLGTPLFASPEQILGEEVDEQSDIYSLAATIYFLLAGRAPFESPHATQVIAKIVSADPPSFKEVGVQVSKELEQVVLRGLARDKSKRYATFQAFRDELAQTLERPHRIANLPRRALAYTVDSIFVTMLFSLPMLLSIFISEQFVRTDYLLSIAGIAWQALYFLLCEAIWGTTLGKRLLSLRVVDANNGQRPKFRVCLLRTIVFILLLNTIEFATTVVCNILGITVFDAPFVYAVASWVGALIGYVAILSCWFAGGRKQLLHELVSGTQTWVASPVSTLNSIELPELTWAATIEPIEPSFAIPAHWGRFEILGKIATADQSQWLAARDETIERSVWIQLSPSNSPPPSEDREKCVRRTRMRFLETGIEGPWRFDAYVAPDGAPLALWFDHRNPMPWSVTQHVLSEVLDEITINGQDAVDIGRWWLSSAGKLTLAEAQVKTELDSRTKETGSSSLFSEIATLALPDRGRYLRDKHLNQEVSKTPNFCVAPLRATKLLQKLKAGINVDPKHVLQQLGLVKQGPQVVSIAMRLVHAMVLSIAISFPILVIAAAMIFAIVAQVVEEQKDSRLLTTLAAVLRDPTTHATLIEGIDESKRNEYLLPARIDLMNRAATDLNFRFNQAYGKLGFLERGTIEFMSRVTGRENFSAKPEPDFALLVASDKEKEQATLQLKERRDAILKSPDPSKVDLYEIIRNPAPPQTVTFAIGRLEKWEADQKNPNRNWFPRVRDLAIIPMIVCVVWGGLFRGGITHFMSGIAVVRRDGRPAWILQCMWRSMLFWLPVFLLAGICLGLDALGTDWVGWTQQLRRCFFVLPLLYLITIFRWPTRGPHDVLSGTYVVPR